MAALEAHKRRTVQRTAAGPREATIMGDREIPYRVLKQVMAACGRAGYERISLAVLQKPPPREG